MNRESLQNTLAEREKVLAGLKDMTQAEIEQLRRVLCGEHQKIYALEQATGEPQARAAVHQLALQNERQQGLIDHYHSAQFQKMAKSAQPKVPVWRNTVRAFVVGGVICTLGQLVINYVTGMQGMDFKVASGLASVVIILLTGFLTGLGIYDEIGRFGGAGSMVPISGFANSIVSAALEFKREGLVYGIGAKIFTIAGPVILYGTLAAVLVGLIKFVMI